MGVDQDSQAVVSSAERKAGTSSMVGIVPFRTLIGIAFVWE